MPSTFYKGVQVTYGKKSTGAEFYRVTLDGKPRSFRTRSAMEAAVNRWVNQQIRRDIRKNPAVKRHMKG